MIRRTVLALAATLGLAACETAPTGQIFVQPNPKGTAVQPVRINEGFTVAPPNAPSGPVVDAFARNFLDTIQARSIRERREYCGYIRITAQGQLEATPPRPGTFASCDMPAPRRGMGIIASYHTHGAYGAGYDNEVPSTIDLLSDFDFGIDGYVSTPGGRVWLVDFQTQSTRQICGLGCVFQDPGFVPQGEANIRPAYNLVGLQRRSAQF